MDELLIPITPYKIAATLYIKLQQFCIEVLQHVIKLQQLSMKLRQRNIILQ